MNAYPTGTVTFLFTDIEGSTALWQQHPAEMPEALARHHTILRQAIESHRGYVFQIVGDAFCAAFSDACDGVRAALAAQRALRDEAWGATGSLRVRMAVHTGVAELRVGDYTSGEYVSGPTLNRCARLLSAGHGGQVLLSQATSSLIESDLPDIGFQDLGEHRLKDLEREERIYQLVVLDLPSNFPPLKTRDVFSHNLPVQLTSFVGREREIAEIKELLDRSHLLTLTGAGGCGKTRLALRIAAETCDPTQFPNGVWFVELAPLSDPARVLQSTASVLGLKEQPGFTLLDLLVGYLHEKKLLLILDNCEHLIQACAQLAETILRTASQVKILATSRETLSILGESTFRVPSLRLPAPEKSAAIETLGQMESVRLFSERAMAVQRSFALTHANASSVVQICRRLDGIPLAIELAAARVKTLSVEQIAQRLDDRFCLLTSGSRTALPRQRTLRALIDWSYNLLDENQRLLFRRLAVFVNGCTMEAAEAICANCGDQSTSVLDGMTALVDKSLLYQKESGDAALRLTMLETIREYAREQLSASGETNAIQERHCAYFAQFLRQREEALTHQNQAAVLREIGSEIENIQAGWDWAVENAKTEEIDAYLISLAEFYRTRGRYQEGGKAFARATARLKEIETEIEPSEFRMLLGKVLLQQGRFLNSVGTVDQAHERWNTALALFAEIGAKKEIAWVRCCLGGCEGLYGGAVNSTEIRENCLEGLQLFQELGDQHGIALALRGLGWAALHGGDYPLAKERLQASVETCTRTGDGECLIRSLGALGYTAWILGEYQEAKRIHERVLELCQETGDQGGIARALGDLGIDACGLREFVRSRQFFEQSLAHYREIGDLWGIADELGDLGEIALWMKEYEQAAEGARDSMAIEAKVARGFHSWELRILGMASCGLGQLQEATHYLYQALEVAVAFDQPSRLLYALVGVAMLFSAQAAKERAVELLALVLCHRASWQLIKDHAALFYAELKAELPPDVFAAAESRGRTRDLDQTVSALIVELEEKMAHGR